MSDDRAHLRADCTRCAALCCVAPSFAASADFAVDKPAGVACVNLLEDFRCGIHDRLSPSGFRGCGVFDCFGAGQQVTRVTFAGTTWRDGARAPMFEAFGVMRQLHEMLWYLAEAHTLSPGPDVARARSRVETLTTGSAATLDGIDVTGLRRDVGVVLTRVSATVRAACSGSEHRGAELFGSDLRRTDLRGADMRGAYLIGANLSGVDLHLTDMLGTDLRDADLGGADLATALFLTVPQVRSARGNAHSRLPDHVERPASWT